MRAVPDYIMNLFTILMFIFVMKDLALYIHGRGKCLRCFRPANPLTNNTPHETISSPGKTFMSIICLAPLLGLHAPLFRLRFGLMDWTTTNYVLDTLDRSFVPFTSMLLSFIYCFTQKEHTRTLTSIWGRLCGRNRDSTDSDVDNDNTVHSVNTVMTFQSDIAASG